jgi:hypothetical protein
VVLEDRAALEDRVALEGPAVRVVPVGGDPEEDRGGPAGTSDPAVSTGGWCESRPLVIEISATIRRIPRIGNYCNGVMEYWSVGCKNG